MTYHKATYWRHKAPTQDIHWDRNTLGLYHQFQPPYFDYISYSELGHFFVPWMVHLGLISASCLEGLPGHQLAAGSKSTAAIEHFTTGMTKAFKEIRRVCKDDARIVFTY